VRDDRIADDRIVQQSLTNRLSPRELEPVDSGSKSKQRAAAGAPHVPARGSSDERTESEPADPQEHLCFAA